MVKINKKTKFMALILALGLFLSSCSLTLPVNATGYAVASKVGTAKATGYLGILFLQE